MRRHVSLRDEQADSAAQCRDGSCLLTVPGTTAVASRSVPTWCARASGCSSVREHSSREFSFFPFPCALRCASPYLHVAPVPSTAAAEAKRETYGVVAGALAVSTMVVAVETMAVVDVAAVELLKLADRGPPAMFGEVWWV